MSEWPVEWWASWRSDLSDRRSCCCVRCCWPGGLPGRPNWSCCKVVRLETGSGCRLLGSGSMATWADGAEGELEELAASSVTTAGHCCLGFQRWTGWMSGIVQWASADCAAAAGSWGIGAMKWLLGIQRRDDGPSAECADEGGVAWLRRESSGSFRSAAGLVGAFDRNRRPDWLPACRAAGKGIRRLGANRRRTWGRLLARPATYVGACPSCAGSGTRLWWSTPGGRAGRPVHNV